MYYDLLAKIQNAERAAGKNEFTTSFSKADFAIGKILMEAGYLKDVQKKTVGRRQYLEIGLLKGRGRVINGFRIFSKPSRRLYVDYRGIKQVKSGYGIGVISTSKGLMSNKDAKKNKVGGESLFEIW